MLAKEREQLLAAQVTLLVELAGEKISGFSGRVGADTIKRIGEVVDEHPDKALAIFRAWMTQ